MRADEPGPGRWAVVLCLGDTENERAGCDPWTTNNRMELLAVISGLQKLRFRCKVTLYTDSKYVANGIDQGWAKKWRANGWRKATGEPALNPDLWAVLLDLCGQHDIKFVWVKGHAGHPENERCDQLSVAAAHGQNLLRDEIYEELAKR